MHWQVALSYIMSCINGVWLSSNVAACLIKILQPEVTQLQSLGCFCLALASVAFVYDWDWLARLTLVTPMMLMLWQALRLGLSPQKKT